MLIPSVPEAPGIRDTARAGEDLEDRLGIELFPFDPTEKRERPEERAPGDRQPSRRQTCRLHGDEGLHAQERRHMQKQTGG